MTDGLPTGLVLVIQAPRLAEYQALRRDALLREKTDAQAIGALRGSWSFCHIRDTGTGRVAAMGRVVGDGGWYFSIADMATAADYQDRGLGGVVLDWLLAQIDNRAPADPYVTLVADPPTRGVYEQAGFRVAGRYGPGMHMVLERP